MNLQLPYTIRKKLFLTTASKAEAGMLKTINGVQGKVCSTCKEWKPLGEFPTDPTHRPSQGGRHCRCKECSTGCCGKSSDCQLPAHSASVELLHGHTYVAVTGYVLRFGRMDSFEMTAELDSDVASSQTMQLFSIRSVLQTILECAHASSRIPQVQLACAPPEYPF